MNRVFVDMDGVIVDFASHAKSLGLTCEEIKKLPGSYLNSPAIPGAIEAVRSIIGMGYDVFIATKPPTGISAAYAEKAEWILRNIPELKRKIIITHDKGLLGDSGDYLIDDRIHKANCMAFSGALLVFMTAQSECWNDILKILRERRPKPFRDYSNFSTGAINKSVKEIWTSVQHLTGATDEQMAAAWSESARKFMDTNMFVEPRREE